MEFYTSVVLVSQNARTGWSKFRSFVEIKTDQGTGFGKWIDLQYKVQFSTGVNFFTS
jgi:hypothetical protein